MGIQQMMLSAVADFVWLTSHTVGPADVTTGILISNDGTVQDHPSTGGYVFYEYWITPQSNMSAYEVSATQIAGDTVTGSDLDTWLPLSSDVEWTCAGDAAFAALEITIRRISDSVEMVTGLITLQNLDV